MAADAKPSVRPGFLSRLLREHARVSVAALGRLWRDPGGTLLTILVVGLTLSLPAVLHLFASNLGAAAGSLNETRGMTLFLGDAVSADAGRALTRQLASSPGILRGTYVSREEALQDLRKRPGMTDILDALGENPLPASIVLVPVAAATADDLAVMAGEFAKLPEIESTRLDGAWMQRLDALLTLANRVAGLLAAVLAFVVVVVVGNTIRLDIESRREEVVVMRLIGAPDSFIRRPFLYTGLWYGLTGSLLAIMATAAATLAVAGPLGRLLELYEGSIALSGLSPASLGLLLGTGIGLGFAGAWLAVWRHLGRVEIR